MYNITSKNQLKMPRLEQVDAKLHEPLDNDAPPTIFQTQLSPKYATAVLNLSIDFLKQQQSLTNKHLIKHPYLLSLIGLLFFIITVPNLQFPQKFQSLTQWTYHLIMLNKRHTFTVLIIMTIIISLAFTFISRIVEMFFKSKIDQILKDNGSNVFGIDLTKLNNSNDQKIMENTNIIVYRNTPIALISISESVGLSDLKSMSMIINTIGCRKVYLKSGILDDLIDWAMIRCKKVRDQGKFTKKLDSLRLFIEIYSFDKTVKETLIRKGFQLISRQTVKENRILGGLFGIKKELYAIQFRIDNQQNLKNKIKDFKN